MDERPITIAKPLKPKNELQEMVAILQGYKDTVEALRSTIGTLQSTIDTLDTRLTTLENTVYSMWGKPGYKGMVKLKTNKTNDEK